jgi:hypothetical protein
MKNNRKINQREEKMIIEEDKLKIRRETKKKNTKK